MAVLRKIVYKLQEIMLKMNLQKFGNWVKGRVEWNNQILRVVIVRTIRDSIPNRRSPKRRKKK